ncbi:Dihydrolipoyllysine-residue acetyltransferase component of pyruvate dehydrogenase complex [Nocardia cerradoensis]|uniref:Dihydrolipoamide acetyltransferase component of pyruvate dehydrogenase complex n=1 Tax=Nocardia cerradoensis TaxID=85688 RepID=A0A231H7I7_9NOCA|nr:2-oxoglutarate dehydrogenase, E2 component, dihydrolipoamide succinyltransferase [Nocardia cerradoensis]OXR44752.1 Dihydrolipoyllysine-residue acetyltransferase component of pyruvate dehydrogenase complex [Nocardia cerradoensis]
MAFSVQMPALGESVTEGTVTRWLKQEGDTVEVDEPLLEVSTDKVDTEIPSPAAGVLTKIVAQEDDVIEVGGELGVIGDADEASASAPAPAQEAPAQQAPAESAPAQEAPAQQAPAQEAPAQQPAPAAQSGGAADGTPVKMPELGESVTEGTVTRWLKQVGDQVEVDEPLLEVSTDKVDTEIPSPVAGTLLEISANEDDVVSVGGQLGVIGSGSPAAAQSAPAPAPAPAQQAPAQEAPAQQAPPQQQAPQQAPAKQEAPAQQAPAQQAPAQQAPAQAAPAATSGNGESPYVTPLVRKLAQENNVDLSTLKGSGVGGRIRKQDVLAAAEANKAPAVPQPAAAPAAAAAPAKPSAPAGARPQLQALRGTVQKANRIRQITATKTRESLQTTAQLTQTHEVDVTKIAALRAKAKSAFADREGVNLTFLPFFAKAAVEALGVHPNVNASYNEDTKEITYHSSVHLGIAVDTEQGLLSPVIHNASDLSLAGLARAIADIANRARTGGLKPDELAGGTFTITNIGSQGALFDTPILVPPQAAMLGTGAIVKRPIVISDNGSEFIGIRSMCYLPLTYDHRLIDGADAGRFLTTIRHRLEEAAFEADLGL